MLRIQLGNMYMTENGIAVDIFDSTSLADISGDISYSDVVWYTGSAIIDNVPQELTFTSSGISMDADGLDLVSICAVSVETGKRYQTYTGEAAEIVEYDVDTDTYTAKIGNEYIWVQKNGSAIDRMLSRYDLVREYKISDEERENDVNESMESIVARIRSNPGYTGWRRKK